MQNNELYNRLGLTPTATRAEIKAAYRLKAKDCHPDRFREADTAAQATKQDAFERLCEARDVLLDDEARQRYDTTGIVERTVDRVTQEALSEITRTFRDIIDEEEHPENIDLLEEIRARLITVGREQAIDEVVTSEREKQRLLRLKGVIQRTTPGDNFFERALDNLLVDVAKGIEGGQKKMKLVQRIEEILRDFAQWGEATAPTATPAMPNSPPLKIERSTRLLSRFFASERAQDLGASDSGE